MHVHLRTQPYFTACAANVNFGYWSHDIGGFYDQVHDPELYLRWVQLGVLSPIYRAHGYRSTDIERRYWYFTPVHLAAMRQVANNVNSMRAVLDRVSILVRVAG